MTSGRLRLGVLISGRGSNLHALIDACADPAFPAEIVLVVSNVPQAAGLGKAAAAGLPCAVVDHKDYADRESFEDAVTATLETVGVDCVCLAGFMRLLTPGFVTRWQNRLVNIHPSLLPAYKGLHTHERALADGVRFAGCTVHFVGIDMDVGPIIIQAAVPVLADDTPDTLAKRVLEQEHRIYPEAVRLFAEGRLQVDDGVVRINSTAPPPTPICNPPVRP